VKSVETLVPAPSLPSMADSPDAAEMVVAQAMKSFAVGWSGLARPQIMAMLQDPAVANTPTAKFLEAFLQDGAGSSGLLESAPPQAD
jgi:hypothetical protein